MLELILNSTTLRSLSRRRLKILAFQRWKRSQSLLQVKVFLDLHWLQGTKATGSRRPVLVRRYENRDNHTAIADGVCCLNVLLFKLLTLTLFPHVQDPGWDVNSAFVANAVNHIRPKAKSKGAHKSKENKENESRTGEVSLSVYSVSCGLKPAEPGCWDYWLLM